MITLGEVKTLEGWRYDYKTDFGFFPQRTAVPTKSAPGSAERVELLENRVRCGQPTFVPGDREILREYCDPVFEAWDTERRNWFDTNAFEAEYSANEKHRYWMTRSWGYGRRAVFVGLRPTRAEEQASSSIARKQKLIAMRLGCSSLTVVNLFAVMADDRVDFYFSEDPIGDLNDTNLVLAIGDSDAVVCCWGDDGGHHERSAAAMHAIINNVPREKLLCVGMGKSHRSTLGSAKVRQPVAIEDGSEIMQLETSEMDIECA